MVQAEQWWKLRNDAQARKEFDVGWDGDFRSASGWLHNVLVSKHADAMENYPEALILPREAGDKQQAKMLSAIIPCILEQTGFEATYSDAWWRKLKTGTAVYKCSWDPDALNGLGEIAIRDVDLLSVFWEPGVRDIQDSRYFFHTELQDNDLLELQYPQLKDKLKGNTITLGGFLSGGLMSGGRLALQSGVAAVTKYQGDAKGDLELARLTTEGSRSRSLADQYQQRLDKKGTITCESVLLSTAFFMALSQISRSSSMVACMYLAPVSLASIFRKKLLTQSQIFWPKLRYWQASYPPVYPQNPLFVLYEQL